jgi:selenoprotein W-related protein
MKRSHIKIVYCTQCKWMLRAAWMAQELLTTFENELDEVSLIPGTGGIFEIRVGNKILWSRKEKKRFPNITEIKQIVRDSIAPDKELGHADR